MRLFLLATALLAFPAAADYANELDPEPTPALWQVAPLPAPAPALTVDKLVARFLTPNGVLSALGGVGSIAGLLAWFTQRRKKFIAYAVHHGFMIAEDAGRENEGDDNFDKAACALKAIDDWMLKSGWRALTPTEKALAELQLQAKHGEEVAKQKVAAAGAVVAEVPA